MSKKVRVDDDSITEAMREEYHVSWLMNSSGFAVRSMLTMYELFRALAVGDETNTTIKQRRRKKKMKKKVWQPWLLRSGRMRVITMS